MRHQTIRVPAITAFTLLIALECLGASASAHAKKEPSPEGTYQLEPPPAHLIKCAAAFDGSPCWPDPSMLRPYRPRLHVDPPPDQRPQFGPAR